MRREQGFLGEPRMGSGARAILPSALLQTELACAKTPNDGPKAVMPS